MATIYTLIQPACEDIYAQFHFDHCCNCGKFNVEYEIIKDDGSSDGKQNFGGVDVSGCEDVYDQETGKKIIIPRDTCITRLIITCQATTESSTYYAAGPPCCDPPSEGQDPTTCGEQWPNISHEGMSVEFSKSTGEIISDKVITTSSPAILEYCEIFSGSTSAP
jgi:hypothetical protein